MVRSIELTSQCLACQVPLAGPLSWPTRALGIHRSPDNPNLCSRCGNHLAAGEIRPVALVVLELEERLRFGDVDLEALERLLDLDPVVVHLRLRADALEDVARSSLESEQERGRQEEDEEAKEAASSASRYELDAYRRRIRSRYV